VVCYFEEARSYLDFNQRNVGDGLIACGNGPAEIASRVGGTFGAEWISISEFAFIAGQKHLIQLTRSNNERSTSSQQMFRPAAGAVLRRQFGD
jgi:hypothetical protein